MVFFVCDVCQESIKKSKVENHLHKCPQCWTLVCVDCSKEFQGEEYRQHNSCISEAEKYQKSVYQPKKTGKLNAGEIWNEAISKAAAESSAALSGVFSTLQELDNVPRKYPKFLNFARNSLKGIRQEELKQVFDAITSAAEELRTAQAEALKAEAERKKAQQQKQQAAKQHKEAEKKATKSNKKKGTEENVRDILKTQLEGEKPLEFKALKDALKKSLKRELPDDQLAVQILLHPHIEVDGGSFVWISEPSKRLKTA